MLAFCEKNWLAFSGKCFEKMIALNISEEIFLKAEKPPRACWIQFNDQCIPENVFYTVIEGSDIKPNTTCPNNNIINALDKLAQNETVASSSISKSIEIFSLILIIALSLY